MSKLAKWIPYHDAWIEIADKREKSGTGVWAAHLDATESLREQLLEGRVKARTSDPDSFHLKFDAATLSDEWHLEADNVIPQLFWIYFFRTQRQAEEDYKRSVVHELGEGHDATIAQDSFWFHSTIGWKENGRMSGEVWEVELCRSQIEALGKRRGERDKGRKDGFGYAKWLDSATQAIEAATGTEEMLNTRREQIAWALNNRVGRGDIDSRKRYLERLLREAGYGAKELRNRQK